MKLNVFLIYIRACTIPMVLIIFVLFSLTTLASLSTNIWLSRWTDHSKKETISINQTSSSSSIDRIHGLTVYSILGCCQGNQFKNDISSFRKNFFLIIQTFCSSIGIHRDISHV